MLELEKSLGDATNLWFSCVETTSFEERRFRVKSPVAIFSVYSMYSYDPALNRFQCQLRIYYVPMRTESGHLTAYYLHVGLLELYPVACSDLLNSSL